MACAVPSPGDGAKAVEAAKGGPPGVLLGRGVCEEEMPLELRIYERLSEKLAELQASSCDRLERRLDEARDAILDALAPPGVRLVGESVSPISVQRTIRPRFLCRPSSPGPSSPGPGSPVGSAEPWGPSTGGDAPTPAGGDVCDVERERTAGPITTQQTGLRFITEDNTGEVDRERTVGQSTTQQTGGIKIVPEASYAEFDHLDFRTTTQQTEPSGTRAPQPTGPCAFCKRIVANPAFEAFFAVATIANAVVMGVQADYNARNMTENPDSTLNSMTLCFTILFIIELVCNLLCEGRGFFMRSERRAWNMLDLVLVLSSVPELVMLASTTVDSVLGGSNFGQLRLLRILRITRLIRIVRITKIVRFIRALHTLVHQIMSTLKSLVWGLLLLVILMYGFSIIFTQVATSLLTDAPKAMSDEDARNLLRFWASVPRSMFTLYESVTGGISWDEVITPLSHGGLVSTTLFVSYIAFTQLAVLNVLTGVFCQNAIESAQRDQDIVTQAMLADKKRYARQLRDLFNEIDEDDSGTLTIGEFEKHLHNPHVKAYFDALELDASDAYAFFKLMDADMGDSIDLNEFVEGCMRLRGHAKGIDLHLLGNEQRKFVRRYEEDMQRIEEFCLRNFGDRPFTSLRQRTRRPSCFNQGLSPPPSHGAAAGGECGGDKKLERCWV
mmetsp:Transcript_57686/g.167444  ORF Transcript_57686/g.167444 Transcript_57686/m.167444 type:complete len:670 (-) Transcript_57686:190-2199(-)